MSEITEQLSIDSGRPPAKEETRKRKRFAVYIYPETAEGLKDLARLNRKTIGYYLETFVAAELEKARVGRP